MTDHTRISTTRTASYEADPESVNRVLLLYSGGLDTSVMLKWIQDEYDAEVVALTVNLGQPGEDYEVVKGKALNLGAIECRVVDAREEFARDFLVPALARLRKGFEDGDNPWAAVVDAVRAAVAALAATAPATAPALAAPTGDAR